MPVNPTPVYSDLNDEEIDAESPLTESVMTRLRDNPRAVARNDGSVPTAELQLAEGMRTALADDHIIVASSGVMVDGGVGINTVDYDSTIVDTGNNSYVTIDMPTTGTYIAWGLGGNVSTDGALTHGFAVIVNNSIVVQQTGEVLNNMTANDIEQGSWDISGGKLRMFFLGDNSPTASIVLLRVA
jgi:hypothetical protein